MECVNCGCRGCSGWNASLSRGCALCCPGWPGWIGTVYMDNRWLVQSQSNTTVFYTKNCHGLINSCLSSFISAHGLNWAPQMNALTNCVMVNIWYSKAMTVAVLTSLKSHAWHVLSSMLVSVCLNVFHLVTQLVISHILLLSLQKLVIKSHHLLRLQCVLKTLSCLTYGI